jgi:tetratricopeptide (TPR) repeat protein
MPVTVVDTGRPTRRAMNVKPLFRKVLLGAVESSLDIAGSALLPGAWPILKGALAPVLERLKDRLGGQDPTSSPELAQQAVDAFEADPLLQELMRSRLLEQLDDIAKKQDKIDADVQKLMLFASGDRDLLKEILGTTEQIAKTLDEGVNLSPDAISKIRAAVAQEAENSREVRTIALREMGPVGQLVERQVGRLQVRAVELVEAGAPDRAVDELNEGLMLVAALLREAPTDVSLRLHLGFIYKTMAQVFDAVGDQAQEAAYVSRAEQIFRIVKDDAAGNRETALDVSNAIHGLGNVAHARGDFRSAIESYKLAASIYPDHIYAWHDMFVSYYELAKQGEVEVDEMRLALERVKEIDPSAPGLGLAHIAQLEAILKHYEAVSQ